MTQHSPHGRLGIILTPILTLLLVVSGCGSREPFRSDRFYSLAPLPLEAPAGPAVQATLLVNELSARGFLGGRQIVFRTAEEPLLAQRYQDLLWEEPVPRAMARALVDAIRAAAAFERALTPANRARADYLLGGEMERFEHLPTAQPPRVVGTLNLALLRAADRRSIWNRQYSGEVLVEGATPAAMAEAFNRLAARLAADVVRDLRTLRQRPGTL